MLVPTAMILADKATRQHVLSACPQAPTILKRAPRRHGHALRGLTALALRRLADHVEPRHVTRRVTAA